MKLSSRRHGPGTTVVALAALVFLFAPGLAYLVGQRPAALENRALAARPSVDDGWRFFDRASAYTTDHLPLRPAAAHVNERITRDLFRQPPSIAMLTASDGTAYPQVVMGQDGWLYYGRDFQNPCDPLRSVAQTVAQLERFADVVRTSGRTVTVIVVPDKSEIATGHLPSRYIGRVCAADRRAQFWSAYTATGDDAIIDLRPGLEQAARQPGGAYLRSDSHWTPLGQSVYARAMVGALDPQVWDDEAVQREGTLRRAGDLGPFVQAERVDTVPGYVVRRPGVLLDGAPGPSTSNLSPRLHATTSGPSKLVEGHTTLIGDSFTYNSVPFWRPWFADITTFQRDKSSSAKIIASIVDSRSVVLQVVERDAVRGDLLPHFDRFIDQLEQQLASS